MPFRTVGRRPRSSFQKRSAALWLMDVVATRLCDAHRGLRRRVTLSFAVLAVSGLALVEASSAAADRTPVTVTIYSITQLAGDVDTLGDPGDYYAVVVMGAGRPGGEPFWQTQDNFGSRLNFPARLGTGWIYPFYIGLRPPWTFTQIVDSTASSPIGEGRAYIRITLWDNDDCSYPGCAGWVFNPDDAVDIAPVPNDRSLVPILNVRTGQVSGRDVSRPVGCVQGNQPAAARICYGIRAG
jgi:hypothetical protein